MTVAYAPEYLRGYLMGVVSKIYAALFELTVHSTSSPKVQPCIFFDLKLQERCLLPASKTMLMKIGAVALFEDMCEMPSWLE
jgi:hypothetical protein